jgi:glycogen debranching enzyme
MRDFHPSYHDMAIDRPRRPVRNARRRQQRIRDERYLAELDYQLELEYRLELAYERELRYERQLEREALLREELWLEERMLRVCAAEMNRPRRLRRAPRFTPTEPQYWRKCA